MSNPILLPNYRNIQSLTFSKVVRPRESTHQHQEINVMIAMIHTSHFHVNIPTVGIF